MQNIILTPHFTLQEFTESTTARKYGIDNAAPAEVVKNLRRLCENTLEPLREVLEMPVIITSGYRCNALNLRISCSSRKSQHMLGQAADFFVTQRSIENHRELLVKAFRIMLISDRIDFDQLILYPTFIHVSYVSAKDNRHRILVGKGGGLYGSVKLEAALTIT